MKKKMLFLIPILAVLLSVSNVYAIAPTITGTQWQYGHRYLDGSGATVSQWYNTNQIIWNNVAYPYLYSFQSSFASTANETPNVVPLGNNSTYYIYFDLLVSANSNLKCSDFTYYLQFFNENTGSWVYDGTITCKGMSYASGIFTTNGYSYNGYHVILQISLPPKMSEGYDILDITAISKESAFITSNPYQVGMTGVTYDTEYDNSYLIEGQNAQIIQQQQATNDKLNDVINGDVSDSELDKPNTGGYDDFEDSENDLKDKVNQADLSNLSIGIDSSSSTWVWDTLTDLIRSNSIIFGMFISILSIGIIKLALGR